MNLRTKIFKWVDDFFGDDLSGLRFVFAVFIGFALFLAFLFSDYERTLDNWSYVGASFGIISALFTGLAFAVLIITMRQQRKQLSMQSEELKLQRKELKATRKVLKKQNNEFRLQSETMRRQQFEGSFSYINKLLLNKLDSIIDDNNSNLFGEIAVRRKFNVFIDQMNINEGPGYSPNIKFDADLNRKEFLNDFYVNFASRDCNIDLMSYLDDLILALKYVNQRGDELLMNLYRSQILSYSKSFLFYRYICGNEDEVIKTLLTQDVKKNLPDSHKPFFDALINNEKIPWS